MSKQNSTMKPKTKQQVFRLAKKHDISIDGSVEWNEAFCEWEAPLGYRFTNTDNHMQYFDCDIAPHLDRSQGCKNAGDFWAGMYEELEGNINSMEKCTEKNCDYCQGENEEMWGLE